MEQWAKHMIFKKMVSRWTVNSIFNSVDIPWGTEWWCFCFSTTSIIPQAFFWSYTMIQGLCTKYIFSRSSHHHIVLKTLTKYWRKKKIKLRFPEKFSNNWVSNTEWDCSTAVLKAGPKQNTHKLERSKPDYVQMTYFKGLLWALRLLLKCCLLSLM